MALTPTAAPDRKYLHFDGLRALAVFCVFYHHWIYGPLVAEKGDAWYHALFRIPLGDVGVTMFFLLSGFLITEILLNSRTLEPEDRQRFLKAFYIRRSLRIFPIYFLTLAVMAALAVAPFREDIWWFVCYATNVLVFLQQHWIGAASHLWTLAVEEQFYLFWPLLAVFLTRRFEVLAILFVLGSFATRVSLTVVFPDLKFIGTLPLISMEVLALGGLLALRNRSAEVIAMIAGKLAWLLPVAYVLLVIGIDGPAVMILFHISVVSFSAYVVARAARNFPGPAGRFLSLSGMRYLGVISYGLYLYHNFAGIIAKKLFRLLGIAYTSNFFLHILLMTVVTLVCAASSWILIERPINGFKRHYPYPGSN